MRGVNDCCCVVGGLSRSVWTRALQPGILNGQHSKEISPLLPMSCQFPSPTANMALEFQVTYYMVSDSVMINVNQTIFERTILQS